MGSPVAVYFFAFSKLFLASFSTSSFLLLLFLFSVVTNRTYNNISCGPIFFAMLQAASSFQNRLSLFLTLDLFLPAPDCLQNQLQTASRTTSSSSLLLFFLSFLFFLFSFLFPFGFSLHFPLFNIRTYNNSSCGPTFFASSPDRFHKPFPSYIRTYCHQSAAAALRPTHNCVRTRIWLRALIYGCCSDR